MLLRQGYLAVGENCVVRIRTQGETAVLTIKGSLRGIVRDEFEYPVPFEDAKGLLALSRNHIIEKTRYRTLVGGKTWEIDEFSGLNRGLVVAEVELERADEEIELPEWAGEEVSTDARYYNFNLSRVPYREWRGAERGGEA